LPQTQGNSMNQFKQWLRHLHFTDARSVAKLATGATRGVTDIVAGVHHAVLTTLPGQPTRGVTRLVYRSIHGVTKLVAGILDQTLGALEPHLAGQPVETVQRAAVLAALNGVLGDRLQADGNALATPMSLRNRAGEPVARVESGAGVVNVVSVVGGAQPGGGKLLLFIHGLCMNDLQWQLPPSGGAGVDFGHELAQLGYTPLYLRYNSGLHISENGRQLAHLLQQVLANWPEPVTELTLIGHSMGGLIARSACHIAEQAGLSWREQVQRIIFLGTPHHGAPLEKAGNWVDVILAATPYSAPFAKLGQLRSSGITDLRYGFVQDADWQGANRFDQRADSRQALPLPAGVACYAVAATLAKQGSALAGGALGDGLVPLSSALGQAEAPGHSLQFSDTLCLWQTGHLALLHADSVWQQIRQWLLVEPALPVA
jgi:pimeloyl-ACP methyl ester carboxylesterase